MAGRVCEGIMPTVYAVGRKVMDSQSVLMCLEELADKLGIAVRWDALGGQGGICELRGKRILMVDRDVDDLTKIDVMAAALCDEAVEDLYILPEVREILDRARLNKQVERQ